MTHGGDKRQGCSVCGATPAYFDCEGGPAYTRCLLKRVQELEAAARSHEAQPSVTPKEWQHLIAVAREEGFLAGKLDAAKSTGAAPDFGDRMRAKGFAEAPSKRDAAASSMAEPLCYCLVNAAGDMYWDSESCIWSDPGEADGALDCQQDAEPDAGWRIAALYDAAPSATRLSDEPPVLGAGSTMPDAETSWLRAYGAKMIALGIHPDDVALHMAAMDRPDFTEDPEAAAIGEVEQWNAE